MAGSSFHDPFYHGRFPLSEFIDRISTLPSGSSSRLFSSPFLHLIIFSSLELKQHNLYTQMLFTVRFKSKPKILAIVPNTTKWPSMPQRKKRWTFFGMNLCAQYHLFQQSSFKVLSSNLSSWLLPSNALRVPRKPINIVPVLTCRSLFVIAPLCPLKWLYCFYFFYSSPCSMIISMNHI